ncbi:MAG: ATP-binding protein [Dissulfuribacterales bacterium]
MILKGHGMRLGQKIFIYLVSGFVLMGLIFFVWLQNVQHTLVSEQLRNQAAGIYHYIILTRQWISGYGGIYVQNENGFERITPSGFITEISRFGQDKKLPYSVKVAVPNSTNPLHVPDGFEVDALKKLETGLVREVWRVEKIQGVPVFRYGAPLVFQTECQTCHAGLKTSDIMGAISISLPATTIYNEVRRNVFQFFGIFLCVLAIFLGLAWTILRFFVLSPLRKLASTAGHIQNGELDVRVDLNMSEEWRTVSTSFNSMVSALTDHQRHLEKEVKKAVADLDAAYQRLKTTEQYRQDFFANITHDLKTPITAIKGAQEILAKKLNDSMHATYLEIIQRNTEKLLKMIKDVLACAKMESGTLEIQKKQEDIAEVLEDAILMIMPVAWENGVDIRYEVPATPVYVMGDRGFLEQAVTNLLSNAIRFSFRGSAVDVGLETREHRVLLTVRDFGPGIPKDQRDLVFEKFFRRSNEKAGEGMGLGLAIARGIVTAHGGSITISDPVDGKGCVFTIELPVNTGSGKS